MSAPSPHAGIAEPFTILYGPDLAAYCFSDEHPLQARRYTLTMALLTALGWLDTPGVSLEPPRFATLSELLAVHSYPYVQAVQNGQSMARGERAHADLSFYGLGTADDPLFAEMHDAAALYTGATIQAMRAVLEGRAVHAYSPAGGQHHALKAEASGFCIYNDAAAAISQALDAGKRVAYLDLDAHHGDGVQALFYSEPEVLTISIHESGEYLFPGTGFADETGSGDAKGACINVPLPPFAGDEAILMAFDRVVPSALQTFGPDILVTQIGADTHHDDPLTHLTATMALYPMLATRLHRLVHECCSGRWVIVGGGGYDPVNVTPRAWSAFVGTVLGYETENVCLPREWLVASRQAGGDPPSLLLGDSVPDYTAPVDREYLTLLDSIERGALAQVGYLVDRRAAD